MGQGKQGVGGEGRPRIGSMEGEEGGRRENRKKFASVSRVYRSGFSMDG